MSIETWKQEFYAVEASVAGKSTDVEMLEHSIKKWEGLQTENLERHELRVNYTRIVDVGGVNFHINSESCALCSKHLFSSRDDSCASCPLSKVRGGVSCDQIDADDPSPFDAWRNRANPEPMLTFLRKARKIAVKEGKMTIKSQHAILLNRLHQTESTIVRLESELAELKNTDKVIDCMVDRFLS